MREAFMTATITTRSHPLTVPIREGTEYRVRLDIDVDGVSVTLWLRPDEARDVASLLMASAGAADRGEWQRGEQPAVVLR